jgi:hypothetical protein
MSKAQARQAASSYRLGRERAEPLRPVLMATPSSHLLGDARGPQRGSALDGSPGGA